MEKVKTAIVGLGKVAHLHAAALQTLPESEFVAVCGHDALKARAFAEQYHVAAYSDITEMIARSGVQALCICTPHPAHREPTVTAARAGVHVLVEKPLATSLIDCDAMIQAGQQGHAVIAVVSQRRFYPPCQRIWAAVQSGQLGPPILGTASIYGWRDEAYYKSDPWRGTWDGEGGGVLVNQAVHQLDLLLWYMGEASEVFGYWSNLNHPYIEVDDTAVAVVRFKNGALGNIVVSNSQNPPLHARVGVHGANGGSVGVQTDGGAMFIAGVTTEIEPPYNDVWTIKGEEHKLGAWRKEDAELFASVDPLRHFHRLQIEDFLQSLLTGRSPAVTAADGRRAVELFTGIYQASTTGRSVQFPLSAPAPGRGHIL